MPVCSKCKIDKDISEFHRDRRAACGHTSDCRTCRAERGRRYHQTHTIRPMSRQETERYLDQHFDYQPASRTLLYKGKPWQPGKQPKQGSVWLILSNVTTRKGVLLEAVLWWLFYRRWPKPGFKLVNRNNDPNDLDIFNWREVPVALTRRKRRTQKTTGSSRAIGVSRDRSSGGYKARLRVNGKELHLGCYRTEREAAEAYNKAAQAHFGEFATLNVLDGLDGQAPAKPVRVKPAKKAKAARRVKPVRKVKPLLAQSPRTRHWQIPEVINRVIVQRLLAGDYGTDIAADLQVSNTHVSHIFNDRLTPALRLRVQRTKAQQRQLNKENG